MNYGEVPAELLIETNLRLPRDTALTTATLAAFRSKGKPAVYAGVGKWGRKEWVGNLYPLKTKQADFQDQYIRFFNAIELNAPHYKIYDAHTIGQWAAKTGNTDFRFCPKMVNRVSHFSDLISPKANDLTSDFLQGVRAFGKSLGPIFIQLKENFDPGRRANLYAYLKTLPGDLSFFVELRHPGWYNDPAVMQELMTALAASHIGLVITDTAGRRDALHMNLPIPKAFIRFQGYNLHPTDYPRIDEWVKRIKKWLDGGLQELYFFMHQPDEKNSPVACDYFVEKLNKRCKLNLRRPFDPATPR